MKDTATGEGMMIMKKITKYQVSNPFFLEGVRMEFIFQLSSDLLWRSHKRLFQSKGQPNTIWRA